MDTTYVMSEWGTVTLLYQLLPMVFKRAIQHLYEPPCATGQTNVAGRDPFTLCVIHISHQQIQRGQ